MQVFQTEGVPPKSGKSILATIGWTQNSKAALTKSVMENNLAKELLRFDKFKA